MADVLSLKPRPGSEAEQAARRGAGIAEDGPRKMGSAVKPTERTLSVYDGRRALGSIEIRRIKKIRTEQYRARLASGKKLGTFSTRKAALIAIEENCGDSSA
jgi:hypothetical protein